MSYREIVQRLKRLGFVESRQARGSHEVWVHARDGRIVLLARHVRDMPEGTLRSILRKADVDVEDFLA